MYVCFGVDEKKKVVEEDEDDKAYKAKVAAGMILRET